MKKEFRARKTELSFKKYNKKVLSGLEPELEDSESSVIAITL